MKPHDYAELRIEEAPKKGRGGPKRSRLRGNLIAQQDGGDADDHHNDRHDMEHLAPAGENAEDGAQHEAEDGGIGGGGEAVQHPFNELGDENDAQEAAQGEGQQNPEVQVGHRADNGGVKAQEQHDERAADARDNHGGHGDGAVEDVEEGVAQVEPLHGFQQGGLGLGGFLGLAGIPGQGHGHHNGEGNQHGQDIFQANVPIIETLAQLRGGRALPRPEGQLDQHGNAAQDNADKESVGFRGIVCQHPLHHLAEPQNAQHGPRAEHADKGQFLLPFLAQVGDEVDNPFVHAEHHRHGAPADAGNHVGQAEHNARNQDVNMMRHKPILPDHSEYPGKRVPHFGWDVKGKLLRTQNARP